MERSETIKLTQLSHGAGCGCKISPALLEGLISSNSSPADPNLLVGNHTRDDAAVYDIGNGQAIISTTDFFMPIVDDPHDFGAIASVNALSDVYAMGGKPIMAVAILGWPVDDLDADIAGKILEGARTACKEAGIELAGGHSIDNPEPVFGLAVTGMVKKKHLKRNNTARPGSSLYLSKPLGVGLVTTAQKSGLTLAPDIALVTSNMKALNTLGSDLGKLSYVNALTDVTGFGLLGHLLELCEGSHVTAEISYNKVPKIPNIDFYLEKKTIPGGTTRNWQSYREKISPLDTERINLLADPQTSGGLLISVDKGKEEEFHNFLQANNIKLQSFGRLVPAKKFSIYVN